MIAHSHVHNEVAAREEFGAISDLREEVSHHGRVCREDEFSPVVLPLSPPLGRSEGAAHAALPSLLGTQSLGSE